MNAVSQSAAAADVKYDRNTYMAQLRAAGRVPGGDSSKAWLVEQGLWDTDLGLPSTPALEMITAALPSFGWKVMESPKKHIRFTGYPTIAGQQPSLADLIIWCRAPDGEKPFHFDVGATHSGRLAPLCALGHVGQAFAQFIIEMGCVVPEREIVTAIAGWLRRGISGEELVLFSGVCPDYTTVIDPVTGRERYTFDQLGCGVGLVARRVQRALPQFNRFFEGHGIQIRYIVGIGDFEADSPATCERVGLTRAAFRRNLSKSQQAFKAGLPKSLRAKTTTRFVTRLSGHKRWKDWLERSHLEASAGRMTGALSFSARDLAAVVAARQSLYQRWYGDSVDATAVLRSQAPEYMAMGALGESLGNNTLLLGADAPAMASFFQGLGSNVRPVLSLRDIAY